MPHAIFKALLLGLILSLPVLASEFFRKNYSSWNAPFNRHDCYLVLGPFDNKEAAQLEFKKRLIEYGLLPLRTGDLLYPKRAWYDIERKYYWLDNDGLFYATGLQKNLADMSNQECGSKRVLGEDLNSRYAVAFGPIRTQARAVETSRLPPSLDPSLLDHYSENYVSVPTIFHVHHWTNHTNLHYRRNIFLVGFWVYYAVIFGYLVLPKVGASIKSFANLFRGQIDISLVINFFLPLAIISFMFFEVVFFRYDQINLPFFSSFDWMYRNELWSEIGLSPLAGFLVLSFLFFLAASIVQNLLATLLVFFLVVVNIWSLGIVGLPLSENWSFKVVSLTAFVPFPSVLKHLLDLIPILSALFSFNVALIFSNVLPSRVLKSLVPKR